MELWQDTIHFFVLPSHRQESEVFHQLRPSNLKLWDMLRRPKKTYGSTLCHDPQKLSEKHVFRTGFLRVSTAKIRVIYSHFFLKRVKHNLFELHYGVLRVFYGLVRVFYRSHTIQLPGHHEHDENCHDWSLGLFPGFLTPYTVMLWTSWMGLLMDTQWHGK